MSDAISSVVLWVTAAQGHRDEINLQTSIHFVFIFFSPRTYVVIVSRRIAFVHTIELFRCHCTHNSVFRTSETNESHRNDPFVCVAASDERRTFSVCLLLVRKRFLLRKKKKTIPRAASRTLVHRGRKCNTRMGV